jgi:peptide chain release factor 1
MYAMNKEDLKIEFMRGKGPGGQHRNKTDSACRITHIPTGITSYADERSQHHSKRKAMSKLKMRISKNKNALVAQKKKARRDHVIHERNIIRTYNYKSQTVTDHRSKKTASLKEVLLKGKIELLRSENDN